MFINNTNISLSLFLYASIEYDEEFHNLCEETFPLSTPVEVSHDDFNSEAYLSVLPTEEATSFLANNPMKRKLGEFMSDRSTGYSASNADTKKRSLYVIPTDSSLSSSTTSSYEQQGTSSIKSSLAKYINKHTLQNSEQSQQEWFATNRNKFAASNTSITTSSFMGFPLVNSLPLDAAAKERIAATLEMLKARNAQPLPIRKESSTKKTNKITPTHSKSPKAVSPMKDPRRLYPKLFFDTLNLCDQRHFTEFLNAKCTNDISLTSKYVGKDSPYGKNYLELIGAEAVELYFVSKFISIPDGMYTMTNNSLATTFVPNGGYSVSCLFDFSGTKTISLISDQCSVAIVKNSITGLIQAHEIEGDNRAIIREIPNANIVYGVNNQEIKMDVVGKATFCINKENKIYKVEIVHCEKKKFIPADAVVTSNTSIANTSSAASSAGAKDRRDSKASSPTLPIPLTSEEMEVANVIVQINAHKSQS